MRGRVILKVNFASPSQFFVENASASDEGGKTPALVSHSGQWTQDGGMHRQRE